MKHPNPKRPKGIELPTKYDVFLSYATADTSHAEQIRTKLQSGGLSCFMSSKSMSAGENWAERIRGALISSAEVCVLCSPSSAKSEWVLTEWGAAWVLGKLIVPVLHRVDIDGLPERLRSHQAIDLSSIDSYVKEASVRKQQANRDEIREASSSSTEAQAERREQVVARITALLDELNMHYEVAAKSAAESVIESFSEKDLRRWKYEVLKFLDANFVSDEATLFADLRTNKDGVTPAVHLKSSFEEHRDFLEELRDAIENAGVELRPTPAPSGNRLPKFGTFTYAI